MNTAEPYLVSATARSGHASEEARRTAEAAPDWRTLQLEIRNRLIQLDKLTKLGVTGALEESLEELNRKIERYNEQVPSAQRRPMLCRDSFRTQLDHWKT